MHVSQNTRQPVKCDVDHKRLYKTRGFRPVGVQIALEVILGVGYLVVTWHAPCPGCGVHLSTSEPARVLRSTLLSGDATEDACRIAEFLA